MSRCHLTNAIGKVRIVPLRATDQLVADYSFSLFLLFYTCDELSCDDDQQTVDETLSAASIVRCIFYFLSSFIYTHIFHCTFVHYKELFSAEETKKVSLFRVGRCSLYIGLFTTKIGRRGGGRREMHSNERCSLTEVLL